MNLRMPAEWEPHSATIMIYPERGGSWPYGGRYARPVFARIISQICAAEDVILALSPSAEEGARQLFGNLVTSGRVKLVPAICDDCWARDMGPTFVKSGGGIMGVDWAFNAWGGEYDGLYAHWQNDDAFASFILHKLGYPVLSARPFVLEGGSIHSNGAGTIITTEECLLSKGRNPNLNKGQIEDKLKQYLGAERIIWLPRGICGDETNGHVDNICAFSSPDTVLLAWAEDGLQGRICRQNLNILQNSGLKVIKLPLPQNPVKITRHDLNGFVFEEGEAVRTEGEVLAASYVNFYICNAGVLAPQFGDKNDLNAIQVLKTAFPNKKIIPIPARELIVGGGNIHCLTQQIPG